MSKRSRKVYEGRGDDCLARAKFEAKSAEEVKLAPDILALHQQLKNLRNGKHEHFRLKALALEKRRMERVRLLRQLHEMRMQQLSMQYMSELKDSLTEYTSRKEELKEYFSELIGTKKRKVEAVVTRSKATPLVKGSIKGFNAFKSLFVLSNSEVTEDLDALKEKTSEKELELHDYAIKRSLIDAGQ